MAGVGKGRQEKTGTIGEPRVYGEEEVESDWSVAFSAAAVAILALAAALGDRAEDVFDVSL